MRVRVNSSALVWQQRRLLLVAGAVVAAASHLVGSPIIAAAALYGIATSVLIGELEIILARRARTERQFDAITLIARVALVTVLALALTFGGAGTWITLAVFAILVISIAGSVSTLSIAVIVAYTSLVFVAAEFATTRQLLPHTHLVSSHEAGHLSMLQVLGVAVIGFPGLAAVVHLRWRRSMETQQELESTVDELRSARGALEESQTELELLNRGLNAEVALHTSELEIRNRYLSVVNAVSTALGEPGNNGPLVGRAARIAARLLGARAAQGWQTATSTEPPSTFVVLEGAADAADVAALPPELLQQVARRREPLLSQDVVAPEGEPLPDVGDPYAVVPIRSHGESLGAFAVIGIEEGDIGARECNLLLSVGRDVGAALINAAYLHQTEARADRVALVSDFARLASQRKATGEALSEALELVRVHLDAYRISVVTSPTGGEWQTLAVAGSTTANGLEGRHLHQLPAEVAGRTSVLHRRSDGVLSEDVAGQIGTLILSPVIATVPGVTPFLDPDDESVDTLELERVAGALVCSSADDDVWDDDTIELLDEVAEVVARRLESDAFERLQNRRIDELASLTEVARLMQSGADVERLCGGFAQALRALLPYQSLTILRASANGLQPELHLFGAEAQALTAESSTIVTRDDSWSELIEPLTWTSRGDKDAPTFLDTPAAEGIAFPLLSKGQPLGCVVLGLHPTIDRELMEIVSQAVEQLALALDAATLYQQATSQASQIQTQSNLARIVASQPNLRRAFDSFAEEMRWLVPFDEAVLFLADDEDAERLVLYANAPSDEDAISVAPALDGAIVEATTQHEHPFVLRRAELEHITDEGWRTIGGNASEALIVPVRNNRDLVALFVLLSRRVTDGVPVDIGVLSEVASLLAVTIERVRLFERSEHMARHDQLTGLPNFRYVQEHLAAVAERSAGRETSVLMIDLDNLKPFNDLLGHEIGDRVIRIVARELVARSRADDFVGRVGGDEFVLVMEQLGADEALNVASRIHAALAEAHLEIDDAPEAISVSVGIASCPQDADSIEELLREADRAMYAAKALGGGRSALARDRAHRGSAPQSVGRAGRLTDVLLRSATGNASEAERTAIALADRYASLAAEQLGLDVSVMPALRILVIASAVGRLDHIERRQEVTVTRALLRGVDAAALVDHDLADRVQAIADGAVELAWVQTPGASISPVSAEEAVRHLDALLSRPEARSAGDALAHVVRSDAAERRGSERVA